MLKGQIIAVPLEGGKAKIWDVAIYHDDDTEAQRLLDEQLDAASRLFRNHEIEWKPNQ